MNNTNRGWDDLAKAIVFQACEDYKKHYSIIQKYTLKKYVNVSKGYVKEIERFFFSGWFAALCNIDPHIILKELQQQCKNKKAKRKNKMQPL